jgi:hypothetical protein
MTTQELMAETGLSKPTVSGSIQSTRKYHKRRQLIRFYVCGWQRSLGTSGRLKAVWDVGNKPDAPPIPPMDRTEINARCREKVLGLERCKERATRGKLNPFWQLVEAGRSAS